MKRTLSVAAVVAAGALFVSCSGGSSGGFVGGALAPLLGDATRQDLTGTSSFSGPLGAGTTSTFPVVKGVTYDIRVDTSDVDDEITIDLWTDSGSFINSRTRKSGETWLYTHTGETQHVLMLVRPRNVLDNLDVTSVVVDATGPYSQTDVHINFYVVGKFTGFGAHNDLATTGDQAAFTNQVMAEVQNLFNQTGITITYEGLSYTATQVSAVNPSLIGPDEQALCTGVESQSSTGFGMVDGQGLDQWGALGFPASDPNFNRGHGIDVFIIHHFTEDGTVGLSPRPGILVGNGNDTALACAAFLQQNGTLIPRTPSQIATVLTHEIGHFLGLLHTTTFSPNFTTPSEAIDDGLSDTPACTVLSDTNGDGVVGIGDGCQDEGNIMFYQAGSQILFSADQGGIMQNMLSIQEH